MDYDDWGKQTSFLEDFFFAVVECIMFLLEFAALMAIAALVAFVIVALIVMVMAHFGVVTI